MPAIVPRLSETPGEISWLRRDLGAHTDAVLTRAWAIAKRAASSEFTSEEPSTMGRGDDRRCAPIANEGAFHASLHFT